MQLCYYLVVDEFLWSHYDSTFKSLLPNEGHRRHDKCTPRKSLQDPANSAFQYLFNSDNDQLLILATRNDHQRLMNCWAYSSQFMTDIHLHTQTVDLSRNYQIWNDVWIDRNCSGWTCLSSEGEFYLLSYKTIQMQNTIFLSRTSNAIIVSIES